MGVDAPPVAGVPCGWAVALDANGAITLADSPATARTAAFPYLFPLSIRLCMREGSHARVNTPFSYVNLSPTLR